MLDAAAHLDFERAAKLRDQLMALRGEGRARTTHSAPASAVVASAVDVQRSSNLHVRLAGAGTAGMAALELLACVAGATGTAALMLLPAAVLLWRHGYANATVNGSWLRRHSHVNVTVNVNATSSGGIAHVNATACGNQLRRHSHVNGYCLRQPALATWPRQRHCLRLPTLAGAVTLT